MTATFWSSPNISFHTQLSKLLTPLYTTMHSNLYLYAYIYIYVYIQDVYIYIHTCIYIYTGIPWSMVVSRKTHLRWIFYSPSFSRQAVLFLGPEEGKLHLKPWEVAELSHAKFRGTFFHTQMLLLQHLHSFRFIWDTLQKCNVIVDDCISRVNQPKRFLCWIQATSYFFICRLI